MQVGYYPICTVYCKNANQALANMGRPLEEDPYYTPNEHGMQAYYTPIAEWDYSVYIRGQNSKILMVWLVCIH